MSVDLDQPDFASSAGNSSQQAGLWFGLNEDNYVKLVAGKTNATTQRIQMSLETTNPANPPAVTVTEINVTGVATTATTIGLRLEIDPSTGLITGFYSIDGAAEVQMTGGGNSSLTLPASFLAGVDHDSDALTPSLTYAGVFTTHRRAAVDQSIDFSFDNFKIEAEAIVPALSFSPNLANLSFEEGTIPDNLEVVLSTNDGGTPIDLMLSDDPDSQEWLIIPENPSLGTLTFSFQPDLEVGDYNTAIFATGTGYENAELTINLSVTATGGIPMVTSSIPADGAANIPINTTISANELFFPNSNNGVFGLDNGSITNQTVRLIKVSTNTEIPATVNGTGGGDAINLTPTIPLEASTTYRFEVDGVTDNTGIAFEFYSATFTTTSENTGGGGDLDAVSFTKAEDDVATGSKYTSLTIGPDGKLYGLTIGGALHRWDIETDGTLSGQQVINSLTDEYGARAAIGFEFSPLATANNLIAYVSHSSGGLSNAPVWDGKISRMAGPDLGTVDLIVTNLPRSKRDHLTNSIAINPAEPNVLYFNVGSNSAGGAPDNAWGNRKERLLSAATLRLDLTKLPENTWPLDAKTTMNAAAINAADVNSPTLGTGTGTFTEDGQTLPDDGTYNPYYVDAPLTLYGTGIRNAYDLVWHTNGQLYVPTNGTAGGSNSP
ncbi:MAG: Ig-like domain-containing protein, partial [Bacteroidota bacterium]